MGWLEDHGLTKELLLRRKSIEALTQEAGEQHGLRRVLGWKSLTSLGIGAIIGAGIFVLTGKAAALYAGPAIVLSFIISGLSCLFTALCYAEFAAMIPIAGSAYTYAYATLGELPAWIIGWDLILEYLVSAPTVAVGWSGHFQELVAETGWSWPRVVSQAPFDLIDGEIRATGSLFNLPAVFVVVAVSAVLVVGIQESGLFNNVMVVIKLGIIVAVIAFGAQWTLGHWSEAVDNWTPFVPANTGQLGQFGWSGVLKAAAVIFFSYIGFDAVSTSAQEAENPQRDMPIGIVLSLLVCTLFFVAFCLVLTAMAPYAQLNSDAPVVQALALAGAPALLRLLVEVAAVAGLTSVILVMLMGQPRIFLSMAKDGLLPATFAKLHPSYRTPYVTQLVACLVASLMAALLPLTLLGEIVSIGTLFAFAVVCASVLLLRYTQPDLPRPFRAPLFPVVPLLGVAICLLQMVSLPPDTWIRLLVWLVVGLIIYFGYSRHRSRLRSQPDHQHDALPQHDAPDTDTDLPIEEYPPHKAINPFAGPMIRESIDDLDD